MELRLKESVGAKLWAGGREITFEDVDFVKKFKPTTQYGDK